MLVRGVLFACRSLAQGQRLVSSSFLPASASSCSSSSAVRSAAAKVTSSQGSKRLFRATAISKATDIVQHRPSEDNKDDTPFEFNEESKRKIQTILAKYPSNYKQSAVMPLLYIAQEQNNNWVPLSAMNKIAELLDIPPMRVYEVATFYTMYNRRPVGKYHIQLCGTTPCQLCGAEAIRETIEKYANISPGETSADGLFTLTEVECLGACVNAPMIQVNNSEFYENLTPETMTKLLDTWKAGKTPKVGPQNGQRDCEGPQGRTTLRQMDKLPNVCRDFDALKVEAEKKKQAAAAAAAQAPPKK